MSRRLLVIVMVICMLAAIAVYAQQAGTEQIKPTWWPGEGPNAKNVERGVVTSVDTNRIVLNTKQGEKTFVVTNATKVVIKGKKAVILDVKVGDKAAVRFAAQQDRTLLAKAVRVPKPSVTGKITEISGKMFALKGKNHTWNVTLAEGAKIVSHGYVGTVADLQVGYTAVAVGQIDGDNILADRVQFRPALIKGVVNSVNGNIITVRTVNRAVVTVTASDATVVLIRPRTAPNRKGTLADIKPNMAIDIGGHRTGQHIMDALWIDLMVTRPGAGANTAKQGAVTRQGVVRPQ